MKSPSLKTLRNKTDAILTPLIKALFPKCLLCGNPTQVAHHHIHKSKSNRVRYELTNLINLCNGCHFKLHQNESYWAGKIIEIKGMKWFKALDRLQREYVKVDRFFYEKNYDRLAFELQDLSPSKS